MDGITAQLQYPAQSALGQETAIVNQQPLGRGVVARACHGQKVLASVAVFAIGVSEPEMMVSVLVHWAYGASVT